MVDVLIGGVSVTIELGEGTGGGNKNADEADDADNDRDIHHDDVPTFCNFVI